MRMFREPAAEEVVMLKMVLAAVGAVLLSCGAYGQSAPSGTQTCEGLVQLELAGAKIFSEETVAAAAFTLRPNSPVWIFAGPSLCQTRPPCCRGRAVATPRRDFPIQIREW